MERDSCTLDHLPVFRLLLRRLVIRPPPSLPSQTARIFWKRVVRASLTLNPAACPIVVVTNDNASEFACRMINVMAI
jgi:hypothetical protein